MCFFLWWSIDIAVWLTSDYRLVSCWNATKDSLLHTHTHTYSAYITKAKGNEKRSRFDVSKYV